jgi:predicted RNase H-like HicB family nuclease
LRTGETALSREFRYTVLFDPAEEGGYVVTCPSLPGLVTEGDTLEEARAMAADAIRGYLEALAKDGAAFPPEDAEPSGARIKETVAVAIEKV